MKMGHPTPIHKIFIEYLLLNEINSEEEGISGYELKKRVNKTLRSGIKEINVLNPPKLSQSHVYRVLDVFNVKNLINKKSVVIKNRNQVLHTINEKGKKHLEYLIKIINHLAPDKDDKLKTIDDLFSGKILPFDLIPKDYPKDKLLENLKKRREHVKFILEKLNNKIDELERELLN